MYEDISVDIQGLKSRLNRFEKLSDESCDEMERQRRLCGEREVWAERDSCEHLIYGKA